MGTTYNILSTNNYSAFKRIQGNRKVRPAHVNKLRTAIEKDPSTIKYNPILVNELMEIIDGQHRFEAIKQLGFDVYYVRVPGLSLTNVQQFNSVAKQWQPLDYAQAFSELGNENYTVYLQVKNSELSINHDSLVQYLALDEPVTTISFTTGGLIVPDLDKSLELLEWRTQIAPYHDRSSVRGFCLAFLDFAQQPGYDHARMVEQMQKYGKKMIDNFSKKQDYFKALNRVYNYGKAKKNHKFFGTAEYLSQ
jgi:hypothetical protein